MCCQRIHKRIPPRLYDIDCPHLAERYATELADDLQDADCPPELRRLGRTLARWH